jgi:hypothetical protein
VTSDQARALCRLFESPPDEAVGTEPRYIAVMRVFDPNEANAALAKHTDFYAAKPNAPAAVGTAAKSLVTEKGGAK